jgi:hypothetical protein
LTESNTNTLDKGVQSHTLPSTKDIGILTESKTLSIGGQSHTLPSTKDVAISTSNFESSISLRSDIKPISPIKPIPNIIIDDVIKSATDKNKSLESKAISDLLQSDSLQESSKGKSILSVINTPKVSEKIAGSSNEEPLSLIRNPIQADIDKWLQKNKLLVEIPEIELDKINSVLESLATKLSHLELDSVSASSKAIATRE